MRRCGTSISRQLVSAYSLVLLQPFARVVQCRLVVGCRRLRLSSAAAVPRGAPVFPVRAKSLTHVAPFPLHLLAHLQHIHFNFHAQFRLATASTCLGLELSTDQKESHPTSHSFRDPISMLAGQYPGCQHQRQWLSWLYTPAHNYSQQVVEVAAAAFMYSNHGSAGLFVRQSQPPYSYGHHLLLERVTRLLLAPVPSPAIASPAYSRMIRLEPLPGQSVNIMTQLNTMP